MEKCLTDRRLEMRRSGYENQKINAVQCVGSMDRGNTGVPFSLVSINSHSAQSKQKNHTKYSTGLSTGAFASRASEVA